MHPSSGIRGTACQTNDTFDALVCAVAAQLESNEPVDLDSITADHPEYRDKLRKLIPTLQAMAELGHLESTPFPPSRDSSEPRSGILGDYRIIREIGRGGMGVVYEAEQISLSRRVALKVLPFAAVLDQRQLKRFKIEAMAAAQLEHANIVDVYAVGSERSVHYYAMRYVEGRTVADVIQDLRQTRDVTDRNDSPKTDDTGDHPHSSPLKNNHRDAALDDATADGIEKSVVDETLAAETSFALADSTQYRRTKHGGTNRVFYKSVAQMVARAANALDHAHAHGVVHRDIKPSNLIVDIQGKVWITDFGLARFESEQGVTMTGDIVGTLRYMSPEQMLAKRIPVDHRTDIYSLGATLYELLTLRPAVAGNDRQELMRQISFEEPRAPRKLNRSIPPELEVIVLKAISKNPQDRYSTAKDFSDDLLRFVEDHPIRAKRPGLVSRLSKWSKRHRSMVRAIFVLTLIMVISWAAFTLRLRFERNVAIRNRNVAMLNLARARINEATALRLSGLAGQRFKGLAAIEEAANIHRSQNASETEIYALRNETIACLSLPDIRRSHGWHKKGTGGAAFDADLVRYAENDSAGNTVVRRVSDHQVLHTLHDDFAPHRFSPNGRFLASLDVNRNRCKLWELSHENGRLIHEFDCPRFAFKFRADNTVTVGAIDGSIRLLDEKFETKRKFGPFGPAPENLRFSPDGNKLAIFYRHKKDILLLDISSGKTESIPVRSHGGSWSPNGSSLAIPVSTRIEVWDVERKQRQRVMRGHHGDVVRADFGPLGEYLFSRGHDGTTRLWDARTGDQLLKTFGRLRRVSRDGQRLNIQMNGDYEVWELGTRVFRELDTRTGSSVDIDCFGQLLVTAGTGVVIWDANHFTEVSRLPVGSSTAYFHPDGSCLVTCSAEQGVVKWPITRGHVPRIGPPKRISRHVSPDRPYVSVSRDGKFAWVAGRHALGIGELESNESPIELPLSNHIFARISQDGRWVVTKSYSSGLPNSVFQLWDIGIRQIVQHLPGQGGWLQLSSFSPNGRWLVTAARDGFQLWQVGSFDSPRLISSAAPGVSVFSPDSRILAIDERGQRGRLVRFVDPQTGRDLARLEPPNSYTPNSMCFSPDGSRLFVATSRIQVWDLFSIRQELARRKLDWEPSTPIARAAPTSRTQPRPLKVEVDFGDLFNSK